jgi:hypothetical protein
VPFKVATFEGVIKRQFGFVKVQQSRGLMLAG